MRGLLVVILFLAAGASAAEPAALPRNPFWPQGYGGRRFPISAAPRIRLDAPKSVATNVLAKANAVTAVAPSAPAAVFGDALANDPIWTEAVAALHFGSSLAFSDRDRTRAAIEINGRVYAVGDLVSANFRGQRFTWRIESFSTEGKVALKRLTYRKIGPNP